jgi:glucose/mannose-6-phosphate isomerase
VNVLSLREIKEVDKEGLWEAYAKWPASIQRALSQPIKIPEHRRFGSVILGGMGGSGSACDILSGWLRPRLKVPVTVVKDYHLPGFAGPETLAVMVSSSGDTKETQSLLREAVERGCSTVSVSSGGELEKTGRKLIVPFNRVERLLVPRASIPGMVLVPLRILLGLGLVEEAGELEGLAGAVQRTLSRTSAAVGFRQNASKKLAKLLFRKSVVVYSSPSFASVAHHFKASLNENAKVPVQVESYPELFHNEVETWVSGRNRTVVILRNTRGESEMRRKFDKLGEILRKMKVPATEFLSDGAEMSTILSWSLALDLTSVYLAVLEGRAPAPTPLLQQIRTL